MSSRLLSHRSAGLLARRVPWWLAGVLVLAVAAVAAAVVVATARGADTSVGPYRAPAAFAAVHAPAATAGASTGSYTIDCGTDREGHHNADNVITMPGVVGGARHEHDYVGNLSVDANSTDRSLAAAPTTCPDGDRSTYYWPVLRLVGRADRHPSPAVAGNTGQFVVARRAVITFAGNPTSDVVAMPRFLRAETGNANAVTAPVAGLPAARWGCAADPGRSTPDYPLCPAGRLTRTFVFPSCWDGLRLDSPDHRAQLRFPGPDGSCPPETFPVPQLRVVLTYTVPSGASFAIDTMPAEHRSPTTDHCDFIDVMPDALMTRIVDCVNTGRVCR